MCLLPLYRFLFVGDNYIISYHMYTYVGITLLASIVVSCTIIIIGKINELEEKVTKENKNEENSNHQSQ
jgi:multidrug efflux pump subunit AcrB